MEARTPVPQAPQMIVSLTPAIRRSIAKARKESASGETIVCKTPEEMQKYFDSL